MTQIMQLLLCLVVYVSLAAADVSVESNDDVLILHAQDVVFGESNAEELGSLGDMKVLLTKMATMVQQQNSTIARLTQQLNTVESTATMQAAMIKAQNASIDQLTDRLDSLESNGLDEDQVRALARKAALVDVLTFQWITNKPESDRFYYIGLVLVEDTLHIDFSDVGCSSHFGTSRTVTAKWAKDPEAFHLGDVTDPNLSDRFTFYFKMIGKDKYHLAMFFNGFDKCAGSTRGNTHTARFTIRSQSGQFQSRDNLPLDQYQTEVLSDYTQMKLNNNEDVVEATLNTLLPQHLDTLMPGYLTGILETPESNAAILKVNHATELIHPWVTHNTDKLEDWYYMGKVSSADVLSVSFSDVGCASHFGFSFQLTSPWGLTTGDKAPIAVSLGDGAPTGLNNRFKFMWRHDGNADYHLAMRSQGWQKCGSLTDLEHTQTYWIHSALGTFQKNTDVEGYENEEQSMYTVMEAYLDIAQKVSDLLSDSS